MPVKPVALSAGAQVVRQKLLCRSSWPLLPGWMTRRAEDQVAQLSRGRGGSPDSRRGPRT